MSLCPVLVDACIHERHEYHDIRTLQKLALHTMRPNHNPPGGGLLRFRLSREFLRFKPNQASFPMIHPMNRFFP